ncbi:MAG: ankyrin repeat domain-containing protein, partial [Planctomycetota bacterium]
ADLLDLLGDHAPAIELRGLDAVVAAAARGDLRSAERMIGAAPELLDQLLAHGGTLAGHFAGSGNTAGLEVLFQLGTPVDATFADEDRYWELAADSTPLHVAAWRARHATVRRLIELGADVRRRDSQGRSALQLAVRAGVASHWTELRAPESVAALLAAGADPDEVSLPTGYEPFDALIARARDGGRP